MLHFATNEYSDDLHHTIPCDVVTGLVFLLLLPPTTISTPSHIMLPICLNNCFTPLTFMVRACLQLHVPSSAPQLLDDEGCFDI